MMPGIGGGIQAGEGPIVPESAEVKARKLEAKRRVLRRESAKVGPGPAQGEKDADQRAEKKEDIKKIKRKEGARGVRRLWERAKPRIKTAVGIVRQQKFLVVALVFFAYTTGLVLWRQYSNLLIFLLPGIIASGVIYRILSNLQREKDEIEKEKDRLKLLEDRNQLLLENALDCVFTLDLQGNIKSFNRKAERVTGYMKKDVIGRSFGMFLPHEGIKDFFDKLQQAISTGAVPMYETEINTIYGRRNFEMALAAIKFNDTLIGVQGMGRDTTDKRRLQKELKMATSDLERWSKRTVKKEMTILEMKNQIKNIKRELEAYSAENN
ncbi:PAS domain S-box protein [archaeon]|nr:PAS domain S-box protein [archaeon]